MHTATYSSRGRAFGTLAGKFVTDVTLFWETSFRAMQWLAMGQDEHDGLVGVQIVAPSSIKAWL